MSLTVVYGARRFKIPVTQSTLLSQVRDQVCAVEGGLNLPASDYGLARQGKSMDLTLPFRFANLVNNAHLDLIKIKKVENIRVKIRIPGSQDFIGQFSRTATVQTVLDEAHLQGQLTLNNVPATPETELASLGGAGGILFVFKGTIKSPQDPTAAPKSTNATHLQSTKGPSSGTPSSGSFGSAQPAPSSSSISSLSEDPRSPVVIAMQNSQSSRDEDPPEMDSKQFLTYYQHIKQQAEPPMVSRGTQAKLKEQNKPTVESTTIRIKFPDQNTLEGKFASGEVGQDVYNFVKMYLRNPAQSFELISMKPHFVLQEESHLVNDCKFGTRTLLVFKGEQRGKEPFLNDRALAMARPPSQPSTDKGAADPKQPQEKPKESDQKKKDLMSKIKPKWLKLHK